MEVKADMPFEKILPIIKQLSPKQKAKLQNKTC